MTRADKGHMFARGALLAAAVCAMIAVYALLGSARQTPIDLCDTWAARYGWTYEALTDDGARAFTPVFGADTYGMDALGDDCRAVRISRVMTEASGSALALYPSEAGLEITLGGETLYSDFQTAPRDPNTYPTPADADFAATAPRDPNTYPTPTDADFAATAPRDPNAYPTLTDADFAATAPRDLSGFLMLTDADFAAHLHAFRTLRFSLPADYAGKTLTVTTYFPQTVEGARLPVYPVVETEWSSDGAAIASVQPVTAMTLFAVMAVLLLAMFLVDGAHGLCDRRFVYLAAYYITLFLGTAYTSLPGVYSKLQTYWALGMAEHLYPTFLCLALATRLTGWRKRSLAAASVLQGVYTVCAAANHYAHDGFVRAPDDGQSAAALLAFTILLLIAERTQKKTRANKRACTLTASVAVAVTVAYALLDARRHGMPLPLYFQNILDSAWEFGNFLPLVQPISAIAAYSLSILLAWLFVSRTLDQQRAHLAIAERSRWTLEHYQSLLDAEEKDRALRHETNHHLSAISALLESGEYARASAYVHSVSQQAQDARPGAVSRNLLVSAIVGHYFERAKADGIACDARVLVPAEIPIADEDLCVYLTNLLENALEACKQCERGAARHIRFTMEKQGNFIYIGCKNSARATVPLGEDGLPATTKAAPDQHGYGMLAMRRVAEQYNSALLIEQTPGEFSVMTNLSNPPACSA